MAEPFDTLAAQLTDVIERLAAGSVGSFDASAEIAAIMSGLAPDQWAQLTQVIQVMGRVDGMLFVTGTPAATLGAVGSTAVDLVNGKFWPPKTALGWTVDPIDFVGAQGPAGTITSVATEIIAAGSPVEVVAGGTAEERTLLFRLPDVTTLTGSLIDILGRADLYEMDRTYDATQFLSRGIELLFAEDYYRIGPEVRDDITDLAGFACTRSTVGYAKRLNGTYQAFAVNEPRITDAGITVEPAATNLLLHSTAFDNAVWNKSGGAAVVANAAVAPDGTMTADRLTNLPGTDPDLGVKQSVIIAPATLTGSFWFKGEGADIGKRIRVRLKRIGGTLIIVDKSLTLTGAWQRVSGTLTMLGDNTGLEMTISGADGGDVATRATSALVWNGQLEPGSLATTDIITTDAAATRSADWPRITGLNVSGPLALFAEFEFIGADSSVLSASRFLLHLSSGSAANQAILYNPSGRSGGLIMKDSLAQAIVDVTGTVPVNASNKLALIAAANLAKAARGGVLGTPDSSVALPAGLSVLGIGANGYNGGAQASAIIKSIVVIPVTSLGYSDAQLQALTAA